MVTARWKTLPARGLAGEVLSSDEDSLERADGTVQWMKWRLRPWKRNNGDVGGVVVFFEDITERKAHEEKIRRLTRLYATLSQCNQAIVRCASEAELFPQICRAAVQFGGMSMAWIGMVDQAGKQVRPVASYGIGLEYLDGIQISVDAGDPFGRGPTGTAIREGRPYWNQDFQLDRTRRLGTSAEKDTAGNPPPRFRCSGITFPSAASPCIQTRSRRSTKRRVNC